MFVCGLFYDGQCSVAKRKRKRRLGREGGGRERDVCGETDLFNFKYFVKCWLICALIDCVEITRRLG
jgi:hypothetical protein